jgi:hypothetical protein
MSTQMPAAPSYSNTTGVLPAWQAYIGSPITPYYPGATVAGFTPLYNQGQNTTLAGLQGNVGTAQQQAALAAPQQNAYLQWLTQTGSGNAVNPYASQMAQNYADVMNQQFARNTMPTLRGNAISAGQAGSSRAGVVQSNAANDLGNTISQGVTGILGNAYENAQNRALQAWGAAPNTMQGFGNFAFAPNNAQVQLGTAQGTFGSAQQGLNQQQLNAAKAQYDYYPTQAMNNLVAYTNAINGIGNQYYNAQTNTAQQGSGTQTQPGGNIWQSLGGLGMYASPYLSNAGNSTPQTYLA